MKGFFRALIIFFAVLIVLFIAGFVFVRLSLNEKQIRNMAQRSLSQVLDRDVELGRIKIRLGWGIKIDILDTRVANRDGFSAAPMLTINTTQFSLQLLPLLKKQIVVDEILLREFRLLVEHREKNQLNLPTVAAATADTLPRKGKSWQLALSRIVIQDGRVDYIDSLAQLKIVMSNIEQQIEIDRDSATVIGLSDLEIFPGKKDLSTIYLKMANRLALIPAQKKIVVNDLNLTWPPNTVSMNGQINSFQDLALKGRINLAEAEKIIAYLNRELADKLHIKGAIGADFTITGPLPNPDIDGQAELTDVSVSYQPIKGTIDKIYGNFSFNRDRIDRIRVSSKIGNTNLELSGIIDSLADPLLNLDLNLTGNLTELKNSFPETQKMDLAGNAVMKIRLSGRPDRVRYQGNAAVGNGRITAPGLGKPITALTLNCDFKNDTATIKELSAKIGESDLSIRGRVSGFKRPNVELTGTSRRFNLDEVMTPVQGGTGSSSKPPALSLRANIDFASLTFFKIQSSNAKGRVIYENGKLSITTTSFDAYQGQVRGEADFDFNTAPLTYHMDVTTKDAEAQLLLKQFANFDALTGKMSGQGEFSGIGFNPKEMKTNFNARGVAALNGGSFKNFNFLTKLLSWLTLGESKVVNFKDLGTEFKIQNGRVRFDDFLCATTIGDFLVFGTVGFEGDIDYKINLTLTKEQSDKFKSFHGDWLFYQDPTGQIIIDILATGSLTTPRFSLDTEKIKKRLEKKAGEEVNKKIDDVKKKIKDWWKKR